MSEVEADVPAYGRLPGGMSAEDITKAIEVSGYPLQADVMNNLSTVVADHPWLSASYQEEWAYVDSDTDDVRSLDIYAGLACVKRIDSQTGEVLDKQSDERSSHYEYGASLSLFIECKQSELPYIFFLRERSPSDMADFPEFAQIRSTDIEMYMQTGEEEIDDFAVYMSAHDIIGIYDLPFFSEPENYAVSISKIARRQGKRVELTGEEAYRSLTLPLLKAASHYKKLHQPTGEHATRHERVEFLICIAVVRAPMFGSSLKDGEVELTPIPWVRAWRVEPAPPDEQSFRARNSNVIRYMDVVHESHLTEYLGTLLRDFKIAAERLETLSSVITEGRGVAVFDSRDDEQEREPYESTRPLTTEEKRRLDSAASEPEAAAGQSALPSPDEP